MDKTMNLKSIFFLITSTIISGSISAQIYDNSDVKPANEFGFHAGATTAIGLSYRYWPGRAGFQLTALPIKTHDLTFVSLGITALYSFHESRRTGFFAYLGNNLNINNHYYDYNNNYSDNRNKTAYNIGFGPGFAFGTRVRINIMAGYGFYDIFNELLIYPTGEIGLYFRY